MEEMQPQDARAEARELSAEPAETNSSPERVINTTETKILVVEDSPDQAVLIQSLLEDEGWDVTLVKDGKEAMRALQTQMFELIVTDLHMPEMNGLDLVKAIGEDTEAAKIPVVLMTAFGSEDTAVEALRAGASSYIPKRLMTEELIDTVERLLRTLESRLERRRVIQRVVGSRVDFELDNDTDLVGPLAGFLEEIICAQLAVEKDARLIQVGTALSEAVLNAIYHGNLDLESDLREEDIHAFVDQVHERSAKSPYRERKVRVHVETSPDSVLIKVADEGKGFDPALVPDPLDPANLHRVSGRGLYLIRTFMDTVSHNETGNEITMVKRFTHEAAGASAEA